MTGINAPLLFQWDGEAMKPMRGHVRLADKQFVVGETYPLIVHEERSHNSHAHYFAAVNEAWKNLPENMAEEFPTAEHLRKFALIKAGFYDEQSIVCSSKAEALRFAAFIKPMDEYAIVIVKGSAVRRFTAKSQSYRAMGGEDFQRSKQAVLDIVADMIGVHTTELSAHARDAAA